MLVVYVGGYCLGKARSVERAEDMVMSYMEWLDTTGKFDVGITVSGLVCVPYVFKLNGRIAYEGQAELTVKTSSVQFAS